MLGVEEGGGGGGGGGGKNLNRLRIGTSVSGLFLVKELVIFSALPFHILLCFKVFQTSPRQFIRCGLLRFFFFCFFFSFFFSNAAL